MVDSNQIQAYLEGISRRYGQWRGENALTATISAQQAKFTFEQFVQTEERQSDEKPQKKTFRTFQGIREYLKSEHVVLVGSPGIGKSSALWQCLDALAQEELKATEPRIPVLIQLKTYQDSFVSTADPYGLLSLIQRSLRPHLRLSLPEIDSLLCDQHLVLLLDGLNEIPAGVFRTNLQAFRNECCELKIPLICSTRELGGGDLGIQRKLEIQPLKSGETERFLRECLPEHKEQVRQLLQRDRRDLSCTPFVLWMLYHLLKETGTVAETLGEAFRQFFRDHCRNYKGDVQVSEERRKAWNSWMEHLAFEMLSSPDPLDPGLVIAKEKAENILTERFGDLQSEGSRILELEKYYLLAPVSDKETSFKHQLIQEYYAAERLLEKLQEEPQLLQRRSGQEYTLFQMHYLNYLKWTEVISLLLELPDLRQKANQLIELAMELDLHLGTSLISRVYPDLREDITSSIFEGLGDQKIGFVQRIRLLSNTHSEYAAFELFEELENAKNSEMIFEIAYALRENNINSISSKLSEKLDKENDVTLLASICILGKLGDEQTALKLQRLYSNSEITAKEQILQALYDIDLSSAFEFLVHALDEETGIVCKKAIELLGDVGDESIIKSLIKVAVQSKSLVIHCVAADALRKIDSDRAVKELCKTLESSENLEPRKNSVEILGEIGNSLAVHKLVEEIEEIEDIHISWKAVEAIVEIGDEKAVLKLLEFFEKESWHGEKAALYGEQVAFALGELGDSRAVPYLVDSLDHWLIQFRVEAVKALGKIGDKTAISDLKRILEKGFGDDYSSRELREDVLVSLAKLGDETVRIALLKILEERAFGRSLYRDDWWGAFEAIENISDDLVVRKLIQFLRSENPRVRWKSAELLGNLFAENAIDELICLLGGKDSIVRSQSIKALGKLDAKKVFSAILNLLDTNNLSDATKSSAIRVLGCLEFQPVVAVLLNYLDATDEIICLDAAQGLVDLSKSNLRLEVSKALDPCFKDKFLSHGLTYSINHIQNSCGFYDFQIQQAAEKFISEKSRLLGLQGDYFNIEVFQIFEIGKIEVNHSKYNIKTEVNQIIENNPGMVIGKQVQCSVSGEQEEALSQLSQLVERIREKYPNATEQEVLERLIQGFEVMPQQNPKNWQAWRDLLSVLFVGGAETIAVFEPFIGIPIAVLMRLYAIYDRNRKQLPSK